MLENKENEFNEYFSEMKNDFCCDSSISKIKESKNSEINSKEIENKIKTLDMWKEYDKRCLECGSCNSSLFNCTCFTTYDINYSSDTDGRKKENACLMSYRWIYIYSWGTFLRNTPGIK